MPCVVSNRNTITRHNFSDVVLSDIGQKLKTLHIDKNKIGWGLTALEESVRSQLNRESDSDDESDSETD